MPIPGFATPSLGGLFVIDADQRITSWDHACAQITGIDTEHAVGQPCHRVLDGRDPVGRSICQECCPIARAMVGEPPPATLCMRTRDGSGQAVQISVGTLLLPSADGSRWAVAHILRRGRVARPNESRSSSSPHPSGQAQAGTLTGRELEILKLMATGIGVERMAEYLHISVTTVRNHIQRLLAKLRLHSRLEAVAYAHRNHLI